MAQRTKLLSAIEVGRKTEPGLYFDGEGLYLQVTGPTARSWIYRYTLRGKARWLGLGSAQTVSLKEARDLRDEERQKIKKGIAISTRASGVITCATVPRCIWSKARRTGTPRS
jgi:hypothetical protein